MFVPFITLFFISGLMLIGVLAGAGMSPGQAIEPGGAILILVLSMICLFSFYKSFEYRFKKVKKTQESSPTKKKPTTKKKKS